jgi:predicted phosphodiesterase
MSKILVLSDLHLEFRAKQPDYVCRPCSDQYRIHNKFLDGYKEVECACGVCGKTAICTSPGNTGDLNNSWNLGLPDPDTYDVVVLAGDIHLDSRGIRWAAKTFQQKYVIYIAGNHEFYGSHLHKLSIEMAATAKEFPNIHFLDNSATVINGVRFVGATLWTSFELFGKGPQIIGSSLHAAKNCMADFSSIRFGSTGWMSPSDSVKLHRVSAAYLGDELAKPFDGQTVVVTHHLPSMKLVATEYETDLLSAAFASNLDHLVEQADFWIAGHTHVGFDTMIGKCRCIVNPRGYPDRLQGGYENRAFNPQLIIDLAAAPAPARKTSP